MRSGPAILLSVVVLALVTGCFDICPDPSFGPYFGDPVAPNFGRQGTDIQVTFSGTNFDCNSPPSIVTDGDGVTADPPLSWMDTEIVFILHIAPNARLGAHRLAVETVSVSDPAVFMVYCATCGPPPHLTFTSPDALIQDSTKSFEFTGSNFLVAKTLEVHIDGPGISVSPGTPTVHTSGTEDYFYLGVTADATAATGAHDVYVKTDGGQSETRQIYVFAPQPPPPTPGPTPNLQTVSPMHVTKASGGIIEKVYVKCGGVGFGSANDVNGRLIEIEGSNGTTGQAAIQTYQAIADRTAVFEFVPASDVYPTDTAVKVRVSNTATSQTSGDLLLILDPPSAHPLFAYVDAVVGTLKPGGDVDCYIFGQNLQNTNERSFSGIPGLTFSNVQALPTQVIVHIHADVGTPVTGDDATNLTIKTSDGESNPFGLLISPP